MSGPRSLTEFFSSHENLQLPIQAFLDRADSIISISVKNDKNIKLVEKFARIFLEKFEEDLIARKSEWHDRSKKELGYVISQLQAIALLTGLRSELFDDPAFPLLHRAGQVDELIRNNFLHKAAPLKFKNYNRSLLALQLLVRVGDVLKIDQRDEQVCGPNTFIAGVASNSALRYVHFVTELAEKGQSEIKLDDHQAGLKVVIPPANFAQLSQYDLEHSPDTSHETDADIDDHIHEADFIALVGLRAYYNHLIGYKNGSLVFGATTAPEIENWMRIAGYKHVKRYTLQSADDIKRCERLIKYGYTITFFTTGRATQQMMDGEVTATFRGPIPKLFDGHIVTLQSVRFLESTQQVVARIRSWGSQSEEVTMPLDLFVNKSGYCQVIVGQSPQMERNLLSATRQHGRRLHPYYYCIFIKKYIRADYPTYLTKQQRIELNNVLAFIEHNQDCLEFASWTIAAKKLQDLIYNLNEKYMSDPRAKRFCSWLQNHLAYSIADEDTIESANIQLKSLIAPDVDPEKRDSVTLYLSSFMQFNFENLAMHGVTQQEIELKLEKGLELRDIDLVRFQIEFYIHSNQFRKVIPLLHALAQATWLNKYDRDLCEAALFTGLRNKMYDLAISETKPTSEQLSHLLSLKIKIKNDGRKKELDACMNILVSRKYIQLQPQQDALTTTNLRSSHANQFLNYAEMGRMYLYHLQVLLTGVNELNKRIYPDFQHLHAINQLKVHFNQLASEFFKCINDSNSTGIDEIEEKCNQIRQFMLGAVSLIPTTTTAKNKIAELKTAILENQDPNVFVSKQKIMNLRLAALTRLSLIAWRTHSIGADRPHITERNTNQDPREELNRRLFQQNFNFERLDCHYQDDIRRITGSLVGMVIGAIAGFGVGVGLLPFALGIVLTLMPLVAIILLSAALIAVTGLLIGTYADIQDATASKISLVQPKVDFQLLMNVPEPVLDRMLSPHKFGETQEAPATMELVELASERGISIARRNFSPSQSW